jgi:PncC family amidohydrolase
MLKSKLMADEISRVAQSVHELFRARGITLSVAESCTGGFISSALTALPGASAFFRAGVTAYSAETKKGLLGVPEDTISRHGMVSEAVAREMAERMRVLAGTDYSVSTTGNLGPDVLEGKERGLIFVSASREGKTVCRELRLEGGREAVREKAALSAMGFLIELVEQDG